MIAVTPAEPSDAADIAMLAEEMDGFYGATEVQPLDLRMRQINEALFSAQPSAHALLARQDDHLVGFAAYSFLWPAIGLTRSLFLKELYVVDAARRTGVGNLLMQAIFEIALKQNCSRVEWQTDTTNEAARAFYADLQAPEFDRKVCYRLERDRLRQAVSRAAH